LELKFGSAAAELTPFVTAILNPARLERLMDQIRTASTLDVVRSAIAGIQAEDGVDVSPVVDA
jgi:hypothetical protein